MKEIRNNSLLLHSIYPSFCGWENEEIDQSIYDVIEIKSLIDPISSKIQAVFLRIDNAQISYIRARVVRSYYPKSYSGKFTKTSLCFSFLTFKLVDTEYPK